MGLTERELCPNPASDWFAVTVRPNHEKTAHLALRSQELDSFLPLYRSRRRWTDRTKEIDLPLFAGYVFCRFSSAQRAAVLRTPGVSGVVSFGGKPEPVGEQEIASIRVMVHSGLPLEPWPWLRRGERVRIVTGPLRDLEGILTDIRGACHVVVNLDLLQRSIAAGVARDAVAPVVPRPLVRRASIPSRGIASSCTC